MSKCKKVHIGIFFDGTGNNKVNDTPKGAQSNIAKLSELYLQGIISNWSQGSCEHYAHKIYVNGVGTADNERRLLIDKVEKGAGGGGAKRINETISELVSLLTEVPSKDPSKKEQSKYSLSKGYRERIIDVFGFSRGAALARDFINTFHTRNRKEFHLTKIRFNFVGIYDTVGSFGSAGDNSNYKPKQTEMSTLRKIDEFMPGGAVRNYIYDNFINSEAKGVFSDDVFKQTTSKTAYDMQSAEAIEKDMLSDGWSLRNTQMSAGGPPYTMTFERVNPDFEPYNFDLSSYSADKIVHMVASDEVRKNFPLTSIAGSGGDEWTYAGVHSDIGGGYKPVVHEPHGIELGTYANRATAEAKAKALKPSFPSNTHFSYTALGRPRVVTKLSASWERTVTNDITFVTLHRMYDEAIQHRVPFKTIDSAMPVTMKEYDAYTKANPSNAMSFPDIPKLKRDFYHHSAVDQEDVDTHYDGHTSVKDALLEDSPDSRTFGGNDTRYVDHKPKREVYKNTPGNAIKPFKSYG